MTEELRKDSEPAAQGGRSPTGAAGSERLAQGGPVAESRRGEWVRSEGGLRWVPTGPEGRPGTGGEGPGGELRKDGAPGGESPGLPAGWLRRRRRRGTLQKPELPRGPLTSAQKILLLDTWHRSGLPARDFAALTGLSHHTLYVWQRKFKLEGPAGLEDKPRGAPRGSRLSEITRRTILMLKEAHPEWGTERISALLLRGPGLGASPSAVARVLHESGYELREEPTRRHPDHVRRFERARANELWQTDLFTFVLKRQNRRVYLVAFMDDHSRFLVSYGLHATQSSALVIEVLRSGITSYRTPREVLTDNGSQYITWRGTSAFSRECQKRGIRQIVARPRRPQTLGKIERFWGTLWRECLESAVFLDLGDAQRRIGLFIDHYNFQRPHSALGGLVPADRYFGAAPEVLRMLKARVAANALDLSREGLPRTPFYLTGNAGGQPFSVHAEGERVILRRGEGEGEVVRQEVELVAPSRPDGDREGLPEPLCPMGSPSLGDREAEHEEVPAVGTSPLDEGLERLGSLAQYEDRRHPPHEDALGDELGELDVAGDVEEVVRDDDSADLEEEVASDAEPDGSSAVAALEELPFTGDFGLRDRGGWGADGLGTEPTDPTDPAGPQSEGGEGS